MKCRKLASLLLFSIVLSAALLSVTEPMCAQPGNNKTIQRISTAFWNVENLFDTIPSPFYNDLDYTPSGRLEWNTERYRTKLANLSRVISDLGADVIGLSEVENENVVRDLVVTLPDYYNYIHASSGDRRGIDIALLYKGDKFFPDKWRLIPSGSSREFMHVRGVMLNDTVNLLICHLPSKLSTQKSRERTMNRLAAVSDSLQTRDRNAKLIVMGDFNIDPSELLFRQVFGRKRGGFYNTYMLYGALGKQSGDGTGSYVYSSRWYLLDNILLSKTVLRGNGLRFDCGGVFVRDYMLAHNGYPLRSFSRGRYKAGYSDHLPVYVVLYKAPKNKE